MTTEVELGKLKLKNPVILASGTFDRTIAKHIDITKLGAVTTKTITLKPREGNPLPHIIKTQYGYLNSVGLKNPGIKKYLSDELPFWQKFSVPIICSIGGESIDDYVALVKILNRADIAALEVNVSCPNVGKGIIFGTDEVLLQKLILKIRPLYNGSLIVKLTPNVTDITIQSKAALDGGADILNVANTFLGLEIDNKKKKAIMARKVGGYSGPAIKPIALAKVFEVYNKLHCHIIGGGGITDLDDALDFIMCGATAISIGSANYLDPQTSVKIATGLEKYLKDNKLENFSQIQGII